MKNTGNVIEFRKREKCPPVLEWARLLVEYQKTQAFKDFTGYQEALADQRIRGEQQAKKIADKTLTHE